MLTLFELYIYFSRSLLFHLPVRLCRCLFFHFCSAWLSLNIVIPLSIIGHTSFKSPPPPPSVSKTKCFQSQFRAIHPLGLLLQFHISGFLSATANLTHSGNKIMYQYFATLHSTLLLLLSASSSHFTAPFSVLVGLHMPFFKNLYRVVFEATMTTNGKRSKHCTARQMRSVTNTIRVM